MKKFVYPESWLSEVAGVSRQVLKNYRVKGEFKQSKSKGRPYLWSQEGVERVWRELGIKEAIPVFNPSSSTDGDTPADKEVNPSAHCIQPERSNAAAIHALPDLKLVTVSKLVPNKRILFAQNGSSEVLQVIVPSSEVWAVGDPMRIKASDRHKGYYELVGKAPRWRGDRIYRHEFI